MNWYKRSQINRPGLAWDEIAMELRKELGREPTSREIQLRLYEKYWGLKDPTLQKQTEIV